MKKNKKIQIIILLIFSVNLLFSQNYTINGTILCKQSGEQIPFANIIIGNNESSTISNVYGFYSIKVFNNQPEIKISTFGYESIDTIIFLTKDTLINFELNIKENQLDEIIISSENSSKKTKIPSVYNIPLKKLNIIPVIGSEKDIVKALQLMPGVKTGYEGSSGLYVRGGSPDENLILLDGVPVYNANHLFGFFSVFNTDAITNAKLYKGFIPACYNNRVSSVLDIKLKEGNLYEFKGNVDIGLISSKILLEGPIKKEKIAFILTFRRTYIDLLSRPFIKQITDNAIVNYNFYDFTSKINFKISDKSNLYFSLYGGNDNYSTKYTEKNINNSTTITEENLQKIKWGNLTASLRYNYILSNKIFSNLVLTFSKYNLMNSYSNNLISSDTADIKNYSYENNYSSGIKDVGIKYNVDIFFNNNNYVKCGINSNYNIFKPGIKTIIISMQNSENTFGNYEIPTFQSFFYIEDYISLGKFTSIYSGLNSGIYFVENINYKTFEPRISFSQNITKNINFNIAYSRTSQFIHLLTNSQISFPTDLWVPVYKNIRPVFSNNYNFEININQIKKIDLTIDLYYRDFSGLIQYKQGTSFYDIKTNWWEKITSDGIGNAYGAEILINKSYGKLSGWLSYTLSWSNRKFEEINFGKMFPYKFDKRHDFKIVCNYTLNSKFSFSFNWVFSTGYPFTLESFSYYSKDIVGYGYQMIQYYEGYNNYRMPNYHRLDLGINYSKIKKNIERTWNLSIYNAYCKLNPMYVYRSGDFLNGISYLPIIPTVSYSIKF